MISVQFRGVGSPLRSDVQCSVRSSRGRVAFFFGKLNLIPGPNVPSRDLRDIAQLAEQLPREMMHSNEVRIVDSDGTQQGEHER